MRGFRPSRLSGDSEEHQRLAAEFREEKVQEYRRQISDGQGIFEQPPWQRKPSQFTENPMRQIRYRCPRCNSVLESPESLAGQTDTCPVCGHSCTVPLGKKRRPVKRSDPADRQANHNGTRPGQTTHDETTTDTSYLPVNPQPIPFDLDEIDADATGTDIDDEIDISRFDLSAVDTASDSPETFGQGLVDEDGDADDADLGAAFAIDDVDAVKTFCQHCRSVIAVTLDLKHKKTRCPQCDGSIRVQRVSWTPEDEAELNELIDAFTTATYAEGNKARAIELQQELKKLAEKKDAAAAGGSQDSLW